VCVAVTMTRRPPALGRATMARVLVVDDDDAIRMLLRSALQSADIEVETASEGREALEALARTRPDAIVLDLALPGLNGWQFVGQCRELPEAQAIPILVISAEYDLRTVAPRLHARGVRACLAKPFDVDVLVSVVEHLLGTGAQTSGPGHADEV